MRPVAVALLLLGGTGCDFSDLATPAASSVCTRIGEQCQLPDGPLGVCLEKPCPEGATPPCFACTPQH